MKPQTTETSAPEADASLPKTFHPLTASQLDVWLEQALYPTLPLYNIGFYIHLPKTLDAALFEQAVQLNVTRHNALRLRLCADHSEPMQYQVASHRVSIPIHDVSHQTDPHNAALAWIQARFTQPFSLYDAPLFEYALVYLGEPGYYWLYKHHHLITDGWGMALLFHKIITTYQRLLTDEGEYLPEPTSYLDAILDDQNYRLSSTFQQQAAYWRAKFAKPPEPLLPPRYAGKFDGATPIACPI